MTREQISKAIQAADDAFGYSADLIRLVDGVATFRLALAGETVEFTDTDEATAAEQYTARVTEARNQARADAVLAVLEAGPALVAARDLLAERARHVSVEGWTPEHDDKHDNGELARAAACYAVGSTIPGSRDRLDPHARPGAAIWPWSSEWWKPSDRRRELVKAGSLIIAEIERLDRLSPPPASDAPDGEAK